MREFTAASSGGDYGGRAGYLSRTRVGSARRDHRSADGRASGRAMAEQTVRTEDHDENVHDAVEHQAGLDLGDGEEPGKERDHRRPHDRPPERPGPPDDRREQDRHRGREPKLGGTDDP